MKRGYKYLFGPVPSRRLGRSLGVDLTPFKTCTLDCVFCQLRRTTNKTLDRHEYAPVWHVESELDAWIKKGGTADTIGPDEIHLNTAVRPPAEDFALAMPRKEMDALAGLFRPTAKVIAEFPSETSADVAANEDTILAMLQRRPCTAQQIAEVFGMHLNEVSKYIGMLSRTGKIRSQDSGREGYFVAVEAGGG